MSGILRRKTSKLPIYSRRRPDIGNIISRLCRSLPNVGPTCCACWVNCKGVLFGLEVHFIFICIITISKDVLLRLLFGHTSLNVHTYTFSRRSLPIPQVGELCETSQSSKQVSAKDTAFLHAEILKVMSHYSLTENCNIE